MPLGLHLGALVLLFFHTARLVEGEIEEITVEISLERVTLNCPGENSQWWDANSNPGNSSILVFSKPDQLFEIERGKELFCGQKSQKGKSQKIFLKIKGCNDCVELSFSLGASIIVADLLLTLGVLLLVYFCSKKQQAFFRSHASPQLQGQQADHPPPVPNPDYEPIRKGQREVYAGLEPQAF